MGYRLTTEPLIHSHSAAMTAEKTRRRELSQLMAYHVLGDVHRNELVAVVYCDRVADKLRKDGGRA